MVGFHVLTHLPSECPNCISLLFPQNSIIIKPLSFGNVCSFWNRIFNLVYLTRLCHINTRQLAYALWWKNSYSASICTNWLKNVFKEHTDICLYAACPSFEDPHSHYFRIKSIPPCLWISSAKNPLGVGNPKSHPGYRYGYFLAWPIEKWRMLTCILNLIAMLKYFLWCYADISEEDSVFHQVLPICHETQWQSINFLSWRQEIGNPSFKCFLVVFQFSAYPHCITAFL